MINNALTLDAWLRQLRPPPRPEAVLEAWFRQLVDHNPVDTAQPCRQPGRPIDPRGVPGERKSA